MFNVLGEKYYIDLDKLEEYLEIDETTNDETVSGSTESKVNLIKLEFVKMLISTVLTEDDDGIDEKLGMKSANNTTLPFRLSFNSLLNKKIITYY